jgi:membrane-associated protease RseP (regulator of RpoE activity)
VTTRKKKEEEPKKAASTSKKTEGSKADDKTMYWAIAVFAAVAVFVAGFAFGRSTDDDSVVGSDVAVERQRDRQGPGGPSGNDGQQLPYGRRGPRGQLPGQGQQGPGQYPGGQQGPQDQAPAEGVGYLGVVGIDTPRGVMIVEVRPGSPADEGGLQQGDRVLEFDGIEIDTMEQFADLVQGTEPGTEVEMVVRNFGDERTVQIVIGPRPQ